jgi:hypothetical protein
MTYLSAQYIYRIKKSLRWFMSFVVSTPMLITPVGVLLQDDEEDGCCGGCQCG